MGKPTVELERLNWDTECRIDLMTKRGFVVKEFAFIGKDKEKKAMSGIHSPLFGSDWEDDDAFADRYSCRCKEVIGKIYEGEICKVCKEPVMFRDIDIGMTGWIVMNNYKIIQPAYYRILGNIIGTKGNTFLNIITPEYEVNKDGLITARDREQDTNNPFFGIGISEFHRRFDEIMNYYYDKKKNKRELIDMIRDEQDSIFTSCIPVYSSVLRPIAYGGEKYSFTKMDRKYNTIRAKVLLLNKDDDLDEMDSHYSIIHSQNVLKSIQHEIMELWEMTFANVEKKHGHIREEIHGGRINFSARNVIIPDPELKSDEVVLGYLTFLELYRHEIVANLVRMLDCSYEFATEEWSRATRVFNPRIYEVMGYIINKHKPKVVINRNPTINYGSLVCMTVKSVRHGLDDDYTMAIPISSLGDFNADFDGDILNIVSLKFGEVSKVFDEKFNPRKNMFVSRNDGTFNDNRNLLKDQMIGLYQFNNI